MWVWTSSKGGGGVNCTFKLVTEIFPLHFFIWQIFGGYNGRITLAMPVTDKHLSTISIHQPTSNPTVTLIITVDHSPHHNKQVPDLTWLWQETSHISHEQNKITTNKKNNKKNQNKKSKIKQIIPVIYDRKGEWKEKKWEMKPTNHCVSLTWPIRPKALSVLLDSTYARILLYSQPHSASLLMMCRTALGIPAWWMHRKVRYWSQQQAVSQFATAC